MQAYLPIWKTPGGNGHYVSVIRLLELIIPTFVKKLKEKFPLWPNCDTEDSDLGTSTTDESEQPSFEIAITFDGRSKPRQHYMSAMLVVKQEGLEEFWQKPDWIYTVCKVRGSDSAENMKANLQPFWEEVNLLMSGKKITAYCEGSEYQFDIIVRLPADMKAHWALFGCGGTRPHVCHRCLVTYEELEIIMENYIIKVQAE